MVRGSLFYGENQEKYPKTYGNIFSVALGSQPWTETQFTEISYREQKVRIAIFR